jgi:MYXO-CTERM domain-containing protein
MRRLLLGSLTLAVAMSTVAVTHAHIQIMYPEQRRTEQKAGPCGIANDARGDKITYLEPGSQITVQWDETVEHPGHFRIMFNEDGFDFPTPAGFDDVCTPGNVTDGVHCLADPITDMPGQPNYTFDVTLPDVECDNCTLQLIQMMTDKPPYGDGNDIYYQCADMVLSEGAGGGSGTSSSTGTGTTTTTNTNPGAGGSGAGSGAGGSDGIDVTPSEGDESGCACRAGGASDAPAPAAAAAAALGLLALASRRRRRPAG